MFGWRTSTDEALEGEDDAEMADRVSRGVLPGNLGPDV